MRNRRGGSGPAGWGALALALIALASGAGRAAQSAPVQSAAASGWTNAAPDYRFAFPRDHASHPDSRIEWWYYTGNVATSTGRRFGYQVTFFRVGVDHTPVNPSRWAVRDVYMAHLAVSDPDGNRYRFDERLSRGGPGLSGAATDRYRVWNDDWSAGLDAQGRHRLTARAAAAGVSLVLDEGKPPALNGVAGFSQKGAEAGNASNYYSLTRMPTRGTIEVDGERFEVTGESWMDHEFGTSFLEPAQQGWDWLSLQLDDQRELMLYQLRRADGTRDPRSSGTLVDAQGRTRHLTDADFTLTPGADTFRAPSGATYPVSWTIDVPGEQIRLTVTTPLRNQELATAGAGIAYWEGMVQVTGASRGRPVAGRGYLEMTGYAGSLGRVMSFTAPR
ncbi:MAG: lipocalin-like domain-containing protein [Vicinamibacterales bacterium]